MVRIRTTSFSTNFTLLPGLDKDFAVPFANSSSYASSVAVVADLSVRQSTTNLPTMATNTKRTSSALAPIKQQKQNAAVHIVRVKVLGLAGVVVDNTPNEKSPSLPPEHMKAAIVLSRDGRPVGNANSSNGWAASNLSLPLRPSPGEDVVTPRDDVSFSGDTKASRMSTLTKSSLRMQQKDAEKGAVEVAPPGSVRSAGRFLAVWDGAKNSRDGAEPVVLEFETPLARTESTSQAMSSAGAGDVSIASVTTSRFAPKSFNIGIVLSPSVSGIDAGCAYPLGAACLTIIGDDAELGERVIDLPVLSTAATRPMVGPGSASKERKMVDLQTGRDIRSLKEMEEHLTGVFSAAVSMSEANSSKVGKKKSRSPLKKFLSKKSKGDAKKTTATPLVTPRSQLEVFPDKYSIDSSGDAVLRLSIEVYPKPEPDLSMPATVPAIAAKRRGSGSKITVVDDAQEKAQNSLPVPSAAARPVALNKRNPSDEITEAIATHREDKVTVGASVLGAISKEEDETTFGSTSKSEPSLGMIESNETDLTRETGTVGTGTVGDGTTGQSTIGTDVETAVSFKMTSSFVNRFTSEVASMAREARAEGEKTGNIFEAYFDTFVLAGCRPVSKDDNDEKSDHPKSPEIEPEMQNNNSSLFPRNSSNNSPRGVDDLPVVTEGRDVAVKTPTVGEKITSILTCGVGTPSLEPMVDNDKPTRFVDRTPPPADQRPPREIVPDSDIGSIGDLTENTFDYYTKRIGATSRMRSTPYDVRNQDMYGMNGPDDMTMGKEDDSVPFPAVINSSMCEGICPYEEAKKFGQEI